MQDFSARLAGLIAEPSQDVAGDPARLARVERTRGEMMLQGSAITATLAAAAPTLPELGARVVAACIRRVVVAGCGDSWFAGLAVRHAFETLLGVPCEAAQALDFAAYGLADAATLLIGISAGGNTPAVMAALRAGRDRGALCVGISNAPGSPILTEFGSGLVVHATRRGWPTQSSTATMALLIALASEIAGRRHELGKISGLLDTLPEKLDAQMQAIAAGIAARPLLLFTGLGPNFAAACIGAAKIRELSPIHAMAFPLEELHHYRSQKRDDVLVLVATDAPSLERALDTALVSHSRGGHTIALLSAEAPEIEASEIEARVQAVVRLPAVAPMLSAFPSSVALHLLAYHFAKARDALGLGAA